MSSLAIPNVGTDVITIILDVLLCVIIRIRNGSGVKHIHQGSEGTSAAIMRSGREHDQGVAPAGKKIRQTCAL